MPATDTVSLWDLQDERCLVSCDTEMNSLMSLNGKCLGHARVDCRHFCFTFYSPQSAHVNHDVNPGVKYLIAGGHSYEEQKLVRCHSYTSQCAHHNFYLCRVSHN